jgi:hypothetical protein
MFSFAVSRHLVPDEKCTYKNCAQSVRWMFQQITSKIAAMSFANSRYITPLAVSSRVLF